MVEESFDVSCVFGVEPPETGDRRKKANANGAKCWSMAYHLSDYIRACSTLSAGTVILCFHRKPQESHGLHCALTGITALRLPDLRQPEFHPHGLIIFWIFCAA
jgi:hypothetical protein